MMIRKTIALATLALGACGDGGSDEPPPTEEDGPVYVMMTQVYTTDDRIIYFSLTDSLDVAGVSFGDSIEAPGVANFTTLAGKLYISSGEQPKITQYTVAADRSVVATGEVSFGAYPLGDNANFYYHLIVDQNLAYVPYETNKRIAWNPAEMTIISDEPTSSLPMTANGLTLNQAGNRTAVKFASGPVAAPFFYTDENWEVFSPTSPIVTYDKVTHAEAKVENVACPGLTLTTRDEDGNTYFSTNAYSPMKALYGIAPAPCVAKMSAAGTLTTLDLLAMTGGRHTLGFRYLQNGLAVAQVLDHASLGLDFTQPYDPAVEEASYAAYDLWLFDLKAGTAKQVQGLDIPDVPNQHAVIDGRMFLFGVFDEYGKTRVYELSADGVLTKKFDVAGDVFKWERLR